MKRNILFFFLLIQIIVGKKINELPIHKIGIKDVSDIFQKDGALVNIILKIGTINVFLLESADQSYSQKTESF